MKKVIFLILALALLFTLAGCRGMDDGYVTDSPSANGSGTTGTNGSYNGTDDNGVVGGSGNNTCSNSGSGSSSGSGNTGTGSGSGSNSGSAAGDLTRRNDFVNDSLTGSGSAGAYSGNGLAGNGGAR